MRRLHPARACHTPGPCRRPAEGFHAGGNNPGDGDILAGSRLRFRAVPPLAAGDPEGAPAGDTVDYVELLKNNTVVKKTPNPMLLRKLIAE